MGFTEPIDINLLLAKIKVVFPAFKYERCKHIKHGYDHDILIIDEYVYRFPKTDYYLKQLKSEGDLISYLSTKTDVNIPIYDYIAEDYSFARHKFIKGVEVTKDTFQGLPTAKIDEITTNIASFLSILHSIPNSKYTDFGFVENKNHTALGEVFNYVPTHSDLDINNMIWDDNDGLGIIDFGDRCLFDPAYDFTIFPIFGGSFLNDIYRKYKGTKEPSFLKRVHLYYNRYYSNNG